MKIAVRLGRHLNPGPCDFPYTESPCPSDKSFKCVTSTHLCMRTKRKDSLWEGNPHLLPWIRGSRKSAVMSRFYLFFWVLPFQNNSGIGTCLFWLLIAINWLLAASQGRCKKLGSQIGMKSLVWVFAWQGATAFTPFCPRVVRRIMQKCRKTGLCEIRATDLPLSPPLYTLGYSINALRPYEIL